MRIGIRAARVNAGLTQEEAAKRLKISRNTLLDWERGIVKKPYAHGRLLSSLYGVPYEDLILPQNLT